MNKDSDVDLFEEFEFKPMTEGLGFHKKAVRLRDEVDQVGLTSTPYKNQIPDFNDFLADEGLGDSPQKAADPKPSTVPLSADRSLDFDLEAEEPQSAVERDFLAQLQGRSRSPRTSPEPSKLKISQPLPRKDSAGERGLHTALNRVEPQLKVDFLEDKLLEDKLETPNLDKKILYRTEPEVQYRKIPTNMTSAVFDGIVAFTLSILFVVSMMLVTEVDLVEVLFNAQTQLAIQSSLALLYFSILQLYMVIARSVCGATLGEWAFDVHLAQRNGRRGVLFPLLVIWRSLVTVASGLIVLPILSFLLRRDLSAYLTGTQLFQRK